MSAIQTFTGRFVDPCTMTADDVAIEDIAHALSMQCRFGGHCSRFYAVGQHSVHTAEIVMDWMGGSSVTEALSALMHDAAEAYLVDIPRPVKHSEDLRGYRLLESHVDRVVRERFELPADLPERVHVADEIMLATEAQQLMPGPLHTWHLSEKPLQKWLPNWRPGEARSSFLMLFRLLDGLRRAERSNGGAK